MVLVMSLVALRLLGWLGVRALASWVTCLRAGLALMFLVTASAHWGVRRPDLVRMVPPDFPNPEFLVTFTGIAEIAGAAGLLIPRLAPLAAAGLAGLLVAVFPANVHAARHALMIGGREATPLVTRAVLQVVFLIAVLAAGFGSRGLGSRRDAQPTRPKVDEEQGAATS
jgi:uncharacterized membrane protein